MHCHTSIFFPIKAPPKFLRNKMTFNEELKKHFLSKLNANYRCVKLLCLHCHSPDRLWYYKQIFYLFNKNFFLVILPCSYLLLNLILWEVEVSLLCVCIGYPPQPPVSCPVSLLPLVSHNRLLPVIPTHLCQPSCRPSVPADLPLPGPRLKTSYG